MKHRSALAREGEHHAARRRAAREYDLPVSVGFHHRSPAAVRERNRKRARAGYRRMHDIAPRAGKSSAELGRKRIAVRKRDELFVRLLHSRARLGDGNLLLRDVLRIDAPPVVFAAADVDPAVVDAVRAAKIKKNRVVQRERGGVAEIAAGINAMNNPADTAKANATLCPL